ncbi:prepilin peptidase-dependent protein [Edaphovirga cremea]|uniref:prepilin peptidase-dependent protein n=1 Tax=Edaphovirga cremea TaxID=2267246 RepID=UPI003988F147
MDTHLDRQHLGKRYLYRRHTYKQRPYKHRPCKQGVTAQSGMTLIETLLVMVLIGMMTTWGLSSWRSYQQALQLEQSAQQLLAFLTTQQADANWRNESVVLWVKQGKGGCVGTHAVSPECANAGGRVFRLPYSSVSLSDFSANNMGFYGLRNAALPGHIRLSSNAGSVRVILSARGRLRLCSEKQQVLGIGVCAQ